MLVLLFVFFETQMSKILLCKIYMFSYCVLAGNYIRYDLNMPKCLPKRKGGAKDFYNDSPLTVQGHFQAKLVGELSHYRVTGFHPKLVIIIVIIGWRGYREPDLQSGLWS